MCYLAIKKKYNIAEVRSKEIPLNMRFKPSMSSFQVNSTRFFISDSANSGCPANIGLIAALLSLVPIIRRVPAIISPKAIQPRLSIIPIELTFPSYKIAVRARAIMPPNHKATRLE